MLPRKGSFSWDVGIDRQFFAVTLKHPLLGLMCVSQRGWNGWKWKMLGVSSNFANFLTYFPQLFKHSHSSGLPHSRDDIKVEEWHWYCPEYGEVLCFLYTGRVVVSSERWDRKNVSILQTWCYLKWLNDSGKNDSFRHFNQVRF